MKNIVLYGMTEDGLLVPILVNDDGEIQTTTA
jgi:hypothetical protein